MSLRLTLTWIHLSRILQSPRIRAWRWKPPSKKLFLLQALEKRRNRQDIINFTFLFHQFYVANGLSVLQVERASRTPSKSQPSKGSISNKSAHGSISKNSSSQAAVPKVFLLLNFFGRMYNYVRFLVIGSSLFEESNSSER